MARRKNTQSIKLIALVLGAIALGIAALWKSGRFGKGFLIVSGLGLMGLAIAPSNNTPQQFVSQSSTRSVAHIETTATPRVLTKANPTKVLRPTATPESDATPRPTNTPLPSVTPTPNRNVVLAKTVNMRLGPNTAFETVEALPSGTMIVFQSFIDFEGERWFEIKTAGKSGWVSSAVVPVDDVFVNSLPLSHKQFKLPKPTPTPTIEPTAVPVAPAPVPQYRIGAICRDGSRSSATGRGACSHHGGVDYWLYGP